MSRRAVDSWKVIQLRRSRFLLKAVLYDDYGMKVFFIREKLVYFDASHYINKKNPLWTPFIIEEITKTFNADIHIPLFTFENCSCRLEN
jgi:hypothetical protein